MAQDYIDDNKKLLYGLLSENKYFDKSPMSEADFGKRLDDDDNYASEVYDLLHQNGYTNDRSVFDAGFRRSKVTDDTATTDASAVAPDAVSTATTDATQVTASTANSDQPTGDNAATLPDGFEEQLKRGEAARQSGDSFYSTPTVGMSVFSESHRADSLPSVKSEYVAPRWQGKVGLGKEDKLQMAIASAENGDVNNFLYWMGLPKKPKTGVVRTSAGTYSDEYRKQAEEIAKQRVEGRETLWNDLKQDPNFKMSREQYEDTLENLDQKGMLDIIASYKNVHYNLDGLNDMLSKSASFENLKDKDTPYMAQLTGAELVRFNGEKDEKGNPKTAYVNVQDIAGNPEAFKNAEIKTNKVIKHEDGTETYEETWFPAAKWAIDWQNQPDDKKAGWLAEHSLGNTVEQFRQASDNYERLHERPKNPFADKIVDYIAKANQLEDMDSGLGVTADDELSAVASQTTSAQLRKLRLDRADEEMSKYFDSLSDKEKSDVLARTGAKNKEEFMTNIVAPLVKNEKYKAALENMKKFYAQGGSFVEDNFLSSFFVNRTMTEEDREVAGFVRQEFERNHAGFNLLFSTANLALEMPLYSLGGKIATSLLKRGLSLGARIATGARGIEAMANATRIMTSNPFWTSVAHSSLTMANVEGMRIGLDIASGKDVSVGDIGNRMGHSLLSGAGFGAIGGFFGKAANKLAGRFDKVWKNTLVSGGLNAGKLAAEGAYFGTEHLMDQVIQYNEANNILSAPNYYSDDEVRQARDIVSKGITWEDIRNSYIEGGVSALQMKAAGNPAGMGKAVLHGFANIKHPIESYKNAQLNLERLRKGTNLNEWQSNFELSDDELKIINRSGKYKGVYDMQSLMEKVLRVSKDDISERSRVMGISAKEAERQLVNEQLAKFAVEGTQGEIRIGEGMNESTTAIPVSVAQKLMYCATGKVIHGAMTPTTSYRDGKTVYLLGGQNGQDSQYVHSVKTFGSEKEAQEWEASMQPQLSNSRIFEGLNSLSNNIWKESFVADDFEKYNAYEVEQDRKTEQAKKQKKRTLKDKFDEEKRAQADKNKTPRPTLADNLMKMRQGVYDNMTPEEMKAIQDYKEVGGEPTEEQAKALAKFQLLSENLRREMMWLTLRQACEKTGVDQETLKKCMDGNLDVLTEQQKADIERALTDMNLACTKDFRDSYKNIIDQGLREAERQSYAILNQGREDVSEAERTTPAEGNPEQKPSGVETPTAEGAPKDPKGTEEVVIPAPEEPSNPAEPTAGTAGEGVPPAPEGEPQAEDKVWNAVEQRRAEAQSKATERARERYGDVIATDENGNEFVFMAKDKYHDEAVPVRLDNETGDFRIAEVYGGGVMHPEDMDMRTLVKLSAEDVVKKQMELDGWNEERIREEEEFKNRYPDLELPHEGQVVKSAYNGEMYIVVGEHDGKFVIKSADYKDGQYVPKGNKPIEMSMNELGHWQKGSSMEEDRPVGEGNEGKLHEGGGSAPGNKPETSGREYSYRLTQRPFGIGTQPEGQLRHVDDGSKFGSVVYDHPLSAEETKRFSLSPVTEAKDLEGKTFEVPFGSEKDVYHVDKVDDDGTIHYHVNDEAPLQARYHEFKELVGDGKEAKPDNDVDFSKKGEEAEKGSAPKTGTEPVDVKSQRKVREDGAKWAPAEDVEMEKDENGNVDFEKSGVKNTVKHLYDPREMSERDADEWVESMLEKTAGETEKYTADKEPRAKDFGSVEEYRQAKAEWEAGRKKANDSFDFWRKVKKAAEASRKNYELKKRRLMSTIEVNAKVHNLKDGESAVIVQDKDGIVSVWDGDPEVGTVTGAEYLNNQDAQRLKELENLAKRSKLRIVVHNGDLRYHADGGKVKVTAFNGFQDGNTIHISSSAQRPVEFVLGHEYTHQLGKKAKSALQDFIGAVRETMGEKEWRNEVQKRRDLGYAPQKIGEEIAADYAGRMLENREFAKQFFDRFNPTDDKGKENKLKNLGMMAKLLKKLKLTKEQSKENPEQAREQSKVQKAFEKMLDDYSQKILDEVEAKPKDDGKGAIPDAIGQKGADGSVTMDETNFSLKTYQPFTDNLGFEHKGTRQSTIDYMKENGYSDKEIKDLTDRMDYMYEYFGNLSKFTDKDGKLKFEAFNEWNKTQPTYKQVGLHVEKALSSLVNNGEYPINIELSTDCIKREAFTQLLNGITDFNNGKALANLTPENIVVLEKMMDSYGVQTACRMCFVEGKRLGILNWSDTIANDWNCALNEALGLGVEWEIYKEGNSTRRRIDADKVRKALAKRIGSDDVNFGFGQGDYVSETSIDEMPQETNENRAEKALMVKRINNVFKTMTTRKSSVEGDKIAKVVDRLAKRAERLMEELENKWRQENPGKEEYTPTRKDLEAISALLDKNKKAVFDKMVRAIIRYPELAKVMDKTDLIGSKGLDDMRNRGGAFDVLFSLCQVRFGSGTPKIVQRAEPYAGEIVEAGSITPGMVDKANWIGGARLFSFSDFDITKIFDICQIFADAEARGLKLQSYSKEVPYILFFGNKTGVKINMSTLTEVVVPEELKSKYDNTRGKEKKEAVKKEIQKYAGLVLDKNGKITGVTWSDSHSINPKFAEAIFHNDAYNANCGATTVGVGINHCIYTMGLPWIRQVIPFHLSGMPIASRKRSDVGWYKDFTSSQNTRIKNGKGEYVSINGTNGKAIAKKRKLEDYDFYKDEDKEGFDFRKTVRDYIKWCKKNDLLPRFDWAVNAEAYAEACRREGYEPNKQLYDMMKADETDGVWNQYYKTIADKVVYKPVFDKDGNLVGETASRHNKIKADFSMDKKTTDMLFEGEGSMLEQRENSIRHNNEMMDEMSYKAVRFLNGQISEEQLMSSHPEKFDKDYNAHKYFDSEGVDYSVKSLSPQELALRNGLMDHMERNGMDFITDIEGAQRVLDEANGKVRLSAKRRALETVSLSRNERYQQTAISSADGAKVLKNLESLANEYGNSPNTKEKTFLGELAESLGISTRNKSSRYATFETKNGKIITIRLSNHNAKVSNFDNMDESDGISIVVSPKKSEGMINDGDAHVMEYYYDALKLRRAENRPLASIVESLKQALYSGEFKDKTGLAEVQEVNGNDIETTRPKFFLTPDGEAYGFTVDGKIYVDPRIATTETPIHEYGHLWTTAVKASDPEKWSNIVDVMKASTAWDEAKKLYPELKSDDDIADEAVSMYSGKRGAERLRRMQEEIAKGDGSATEKAKAIGAINKLRQVLSDFWKSIAKTFGFSKEYKNADEIADAIMSDLLEGVDPRKVATDDRLREQFVGEKGAKNLDHAEEVTTRLDNLGVAREMEDANKDAKAIKLATGWERGADGKWRYETPDVKMKPYSEWINKKKLTFGDIVDGGELFEAYPELKSISVKKGRSRDGGAYFPKSNVMELGLGDLRQAIRWHSGSPWYVEIYEKGVAETITHELQHCIQHKEGFAKGGSENTIVDPEASKRHKEIVAEYNNLVGEYNALPRSEKRPPSSKVQALNSRLDELEREIKGLEKQYRIGDSGYERLAGEVEARNVEKRMGMSAEERRASLASETEDVSREDQIFLDHDVDFSKKDMSAQGRVVEQRQREYEDLKKEWKDLYGEMSEKYGTNLWFMKRYNANLSDEDAQKRKDINQRLKEAESSLREAEKDYDLAIQQQRQGDAKAEQDRLNKIFNSAKEEYGVTEDFDNAGYILPSGEMLDFSEGGNGRTIDHRNIGDITGEGESENRYDYVNRFKNAGAVRIVPESNGLDMNGMPSKEQMKTIKDFARHTGGEMTIDFTDADGNVTHSVSYGEATPQRIEADIKRYYDEGMRPLGDMLLSRGDNEGSTSFSKIEDPELLRRLNEEIERGEFVTVYRAINTKDGEWYSPMAGGGLQKGAKKNGYVGMYQPKKGEFEQADEHPELIQGYANEGYGQITIVKDDGKGATKVAYNPYLHTSRQMLNDQFASAWKRPGLVTMKVLVPKSELTSGYRAEGAKNSVGETDWKAGPISSRLTGKHVRKVILSRYDKPVDIVGIKEWGKSVQKQLDDAGINDVPWNVFTPEQRDEMVNRGFEITAPNEKVVGADGMAIYEHWNRAYEEWRNGDGSKPFVSPKFDYRELPTVKNGKRSDLPEELFSHYGERATEDGEVDFSKKDMSTLADLQREYSDLRQEWVRLGGNAWDTEKSEAQEKRLREVGKRIGEVRSLIEQEKNDTSSPKYRHIEGKITDDNYVQSVKDMRLNKVKMWLSGHPQESVPYREVFRTPTLDDYYINTSTTFKGIDLEGKSVDEKWDELKSQDGMEHHKSPLSDSEYLIDQKTGDVYRKSDHWGKVATCQWDFEGEHSEGGFSIGVSNIKDFDSWTRRRVDNYVTSPEYMKEYRNVLKQTITNYEDAMRTQDMTDGARKRMGDVVDKLNRLLETSEKTGYVAESNEIQFSKKTASKEDIESYDKEHGTEFADFATFLDSGRKIEGKPRFFHVGDVGEFLQSFGMSGRITIGSKAVNSGRHSNGVGHDLGSGNWLEVLEAINNPIAITRYNNGEKSFRLYTNVENDGKKICVGVDVKQNGRDTEVTNITTAFSRDLSRILGSETESLLYPEEQKLRQMTEQSSSGHNAQIYEQSSANDGAKVENISETAKGEVDFSVKSSGVERKYQNGVPLKLEGETIPDYVGVLSRSLSRNMGNDAAKETLAKELQAAADKYTTNALRSSELRRLAGDIRVAKKTNLPGLLLEVDQIIGGARVRQALGDLNKTLKTAMTKQNNQGMTVAKGVDEYTRIMFEAINKATDGLLKSGIEAEMGDIRRDIWHTNKDLREAKAALEGAETADEITKWQGKVKELEQRKSDLKQQLADKKVESKNIIAEKLAMRDDIIDDELRKLDEKYSNAMDGDGVWTESDMARYTGLTLMKPLANEYDRSRHVEDLYEQLDELEKERHELLSQAVEARKAGNEADAKSFREQANGIKANIEQKMRELNDAQSVLYENVTKQNELLNAYIKNGHENLKNKIKEEMARRRRNVSEFIDSIDYQGEITPQSSKRDEVSGWRQLTSGNAMSFEYLMRILGADRVGTDNALYQHYIYGKDGIQAAESAYNKAIQNFRDLMDAKCKEIFGQSAKKVFEASENEKNVLHLALTPPNGKKGNLGWTTLEKDLTVAKAMYVYQVYKMADGRTKLEGMGINDKVMEVIENWLPREYKEMADWMQEEYYPALRERYNERYLEMYNTSLDNIENYCPLKIDGAARGDKDDMSRNTESTESLNVKAGSLIARTTNSLPIDLDWGAFRVLQDHVEKMEDFYNFARVRKDLTGLIQSPYIKNMLNSKRAGLFNDFKTACHLATRTYQPEKENGTKWMDYAQKGLTGGALNFRAYTALKQLLSYPAFLEYCDNPKDVARWAAQIFKRGNYDWAMEHLPAFRERVYNGDLGDTRIIYGGDDKWNKRIDWVNNKGLWMNRRVDALTCAAGAKMVYDKAYKETVAKYERIFRKQGLDVSTMRDAISKIADREASLQAEVAFNTSQQSSVGAYVSENQKSRTMLMRALTLFQNSNISYWRKVAEGFNEARLVVKDKQKYIDSYTEKYQEEGWDDKTAEKLAHKQVRHILIKAVAQMANFGLLLQWLWDKGGTAVESLYDLFGSDEDTKSAPADWSTYLNYAQMPFRGVMPSHVFEGLISGVANNTDYNPVMVFSEYSSLLKQISREKDIAGIVPAMSSLALNLGGNLSGIKATTITDVVQGFGELYDAVRQGKASRAALGIALLASMPASQRKVMAQNMLADMSASEYAHEVGEVIKRIPVRSRADYLRLLMGYKVMSDQERKELELSQFDRSKVNVAKEQDEREEVLKKHKKDLKGNPYLAKKERENWLAKHPEDKDEFAEISKANWGSKKSSTLGEGYKQTLRTQDDAKEDNEVANLLAERKGELSGKSDFDNALKVYRKAIRQVNAAVSDKEATAEWRRSSLQWYREKRSELLKLLKR